MGTIDATARTANIVTALNVYFAGLQLAGGPKIVLLEEHGFVPSRNTPFVRFSLDSVGASEAGRFSATQSAERVDLLLTADIFTGDGTDSTPANGYLLLEITDDVAHALRRLNLALSDYSSDPANPTAISGVRLRATTPPTVDPLPPSDGFARQRVQVPIVWHLRHTI